MTRSLYALVILLTAITVGCQERDMSGPIGSAAPETGHTAKAASRTNVIILDPTLDSDRGDGEYLVTGQVRYTLTQRLNINRELFDVVLDTQAKVVQAGSAEGVWTVTNASSNPVDFTSKRTGTIDKWYFLQGGPHSHSLHIRFMVTPTTVSLVSVIVE